MRTVVLGKKIENKYEVFYNQNEIKDDNGNLKTVYTGKPFIEKTSKVKEWVELCSYNGEPRYNSFWSWNPITSKTLNISETERVYISEEIFRADLNEVHLYSNEVVEEIDVNKEEAIVICDEQIRAFNKMMIESNHKLKSYCDLHKLNYEDTDCIELFNLVFHGEEYVIEDGVMKVKEKAQSQLICSSSGINLLSGVVPF